MSQLQITSPGLKSKNESLQHNQSSPAGNANLPGTEGLFINAKTLKGDQLTNLIDPNKKPDMALQNALSPLKLMNSMAMRRKSTLKKKPLKTSK